MTAYEMRISDWSSDVCSSDLQGRYSGDDRENAVDDQHHADQKAGRHSGGERVEQRQQADQEHDHAISENPATACCVAHALAARPPLLAPGSIARHTIYLHIATA